MQTTSKTLDIPVEVIIEAAQAIQQGAIRAILTDGNDKQGTVRVTVTYDPSSQCAKAAIDNIEGLIEQFEYYRYGDNEGGLY